MRRALQLVRRRYFRSRPLLRDRQAVLGCSSTEGRARRRNGRGIEVSNCCKQNMCSTQCSPSFILVLNITCDEKRSSHVFQLAGPYLGN